MKGEEPMKESGERTPKPSDFDPVEAFGPEHRWAGRPRCRAWSVNNGRQCRRLAMRGKRVCRSHGGAGGRAPVHGKYSIARQLSEAFEVAIMHPRLLSLRDEVAILTVRLADLIAQVQETEPESPEEGDIWALLQDTLERKRRMADTANKIESRLGFDGMIAAQDVLQIVLWIQGVALSHIPSAHERAAFAREIRDALPRPERFKRKGSTEWVVGPDVIANPDMILTTLDLGDVEDPPESLLFPN